ncbi:hypothetical protein N9466_08605, partial [Amylibacter sp.]|nr:hypothetical protein [Amylibacter sp.]
GTDFTVQTETVTILAGFTSATVNLPVLPDSEIEPVETFTLTLTSVNAGSIGASEATITVYDSSKTIDSSGELSVLSQLTVDQVAADVSSSIVGKYTTYAADNSASWEISSGVASAAVTTVLPGLKVIADVFYEEIKTQINTAASNSDVDDFAEALMIANAATKLFDPSDYIGTNINGDGTYSGGQSLSTLTSAIQTAYSAYVSSAIYTNGDVFGTDTSSNFANASVSILTKGDDTETLTSASEIVATYNGTDTVNAGAGNDKVIGGTGIDTFYGEAGNDHLYGYAANDVLSGGDGNDKLYGGLGDDTLSGGSGDDYILGQSGDDTITTGAGVDEVLGGLGDDSFTIDGSGNKTVSGGAGTDSLIISYSGITGLDSFTIGSSGSDFTLTDSSNNVISYSSIENLTVNNKSYTYTNNGAINSGDGGISNAYWGAADSQITSTGSTVWYAQNIGTGFAGLSASDAIEFTGSSSGDTINFNVDRSSFYTGNLTANLGAGNDSILSAKVKDGDSINMGDGDDTMYIMVSGSNGTPALASLNMALLDGGAGTDTLAFEESSITNGTTLNLTTGGATNFENLRGSASDEILNGDSSANILSGVGGTDTLNGLAGNDILYANSANGSAASSDTGTDSLYGGAGDDQLYGSAGDNLFDGGTGADTIVTGNGSDAIVLRAGDGGATLVDADIITDFTDGTDVLSMDSLGFANIGIAQGTGDYVSHTIITNTNTNNYLAILQNVDASNITTADFMSSSTDAQSFNGTTGNDGFVGGAGNDTFTTNIGADELHGHSGDDSFTIDGSGNKTVSGGAGTDSLIISYSGITGLDSFTIGSSGSDFTLTDSSNNVISYSSIENLTVNNKSYTYTNNGAINSGDGGISNAYWGAADSQITSTGSTVWYAQNIGTGFAGLSASDAIEFTGSSSGDTINFNVDRSSFYTGNLTANLGAGNDSILSAKVKDGDSINMGDGDDTMYIMVSGSNGTPALASLNMALLDGGAGTDTLAFEESSITNGTTLNLTTGGALSDKLDVPLVDA